MASKAFYFCDANFFSIVYFFSIIPTLFSIVIFTCLFIILQETLVHKEKEGIVSWTSDVNCARQKIVFVCPIGMVRVKLIKSQSSQNSWTEITISGRLDQNVPQSFASQIDRWGRHLLAVVHEIKQLNLTYRRVNTELLIHQTRK